MLYSSIFLLKSNSISLALVLKKICLTISILTYLNNYIYNASYVSKFICWLTQQSNVYELRMNSESFGFDDYYCLTASGKLFHVEGTVWTNVLSPNRLFV